MSEKIKCACVNFYEQNAVKYLLGESFHPGGTDLTEKMGRLLKLDSTDKVLDVATGEGTSSIFLAKTFGCAITGVDLSSANLKIAIQKALDKNVNNIYFQLGDAEKLPVADGEYSTVVSECAFCTFPDKETAAREMFRVLAPGGKLGITDMVVEQENLPEEMKTLLYHAACIADARMAEGYIDILQQAGFHNLQYFDHSYTLNEMINNVRKRLLFAEIAIGLKKLDLGNVDLPKVKRILTEAEDLVKRGIIGYGIITGIRK